MPEEIIYWDNNICGNCNYQAVAPLRKLVCAGEQEGLECCPICGFPPDSPEELRRTVEFIHDMMRV